MLATSKDSSGISNDVFIMFEMQYFGEEQETLVESGGGGGGVLLLQKKWYHQGVKIVRH